MFVRRLELVDFRSYSRVEMEFDPGPSVLVGANGLGKTNLVEALGYVATLGSHRVATDQPLVRVGAERAVVRCVIVHDTRELLVELEIVPGRANRARLGHSPVPRARDIIGALRLVLFAPEDLALVRGDPAERRRYLDDLLVARQPRFAGVRADYDRVLKQRNALLRTAYLARKVGGTGGRTGDLSTLEVWDTHLAQHGAALVMGRLELCTTLASHVAKAYDAVSAGRGEARITYDTHAWLDASPQAPLEAPPEAGPEPESGAGDAPPPPIWSREAVEQRLRARLVQMRSAEVERGVTLVGPHRDDLIVTLGELPAKGYASHGEAWSLALALRLAAFELLRAEGVEPVLVLDDVFAELDAGRRDRLAEMVATASQVLVTCAVEADVPAPLAGARYAVGDGAVRRVFG